MTAHRAARASAVAVVLLLTGCGDGTDVDTGDPATTTSAPGSATTAPTPGTVPTRPPEITGTVTAVAPFVPITEDCTPPEDLDPDDPISSDDPPVCTDPDTDVVGTVLIEVLPGLQEGGKISFTVTTATVLGGIETFEDLAVGQTADAWTPGPCAESYPEQCTAEAIRVQS